jgi:hypothetical protein
MLARRALTRLITNQMVETGTTGRDNYAPLSSVKKTRSSNVPASSFFFLRTKRKWKRWGRNKMFYYPFSLSIKKTERGEVLLH